MELSDYLPFWKQLTAAQQERLRQAAVLRSAPAGTLLTQGTGDCIGLLVIRSGQLRVFLTSPEGREITVYRLLERDICLFSASCIWKSQDKRLAAVLLEESALEGSRELRITHEKIAGHLGTAREVVTRMLRYLQSEGMVELARGTIRLAAPDRLRQLAGEDEC